MVSRAAVDCLPLTHQISPALHQDMVSDLAKFLMVLTEKSTNVSIQYKIIKQLETHNVYSSFIAEILLQDESQEFFHHGLTILR